MPSLLPRILSWGRLLLAGWWSPVMAGVTPILCLCRSCRGQATFGDTAVGGVLSSSPGSGSPRWSRQPAVGAAGPLAGAGPLYLTLWGLLGDQPADSATLGIPLKSSPRQHQWPWALRGPTHVHVFLEYTRRMVAKVSVDMRTREDTDDFPIQFQVSWTT
jgi:hypothetical protein